MSTYEVIIIGAGISGLSLAQYCGRAGMKTLVIEKDGHVGGTLHSHRFEGADGFWIELGAHTCYNSYGDLVSVIENCSILDQLIAPEKVSFKMFVDGRIKSIPSQLNFFELLLSVPRLFTVSKAGQSIESYYSKIVGSTNFKRVISPAMTAVICQKSDDFPADMLFKKRPRRKDVIKKFTLPTGIQTIADAISLQKNIDIIKESEVREITAKAGLFQIATDGARYETNALALATPSFVAAKLLQASFPSVSEKLSRIKVEAVESAGTMINKELVPIAPIAGLIPFSDSFYSVVSRDTVSNDKYRGFTFHFRPGLVDREGKIKRISEVLGVGQGQLGPIVEKKNFVPSLKVGHNILVGEIEQSISGSRLFLTGNYFGGVAIEDCVARSLQEFLRLKTVSS